MFESWAVHEPPLRVGLCYCRGAGPARCGESQDWTGPNVRVPAAGLELGLG